MKIYQLDSKLEKHYIKIDTKDLKNIDDIVKRIAKNKYKLTYNKLLNSYAVYIENIPKRICKYKDITVVIENNEIRYFSDLCY